MTPRPRSPRRTMLHWTETAADANRPRRTREAVSRQVRRRRSTGSGELLRCRGAAVAQELGATLGLVLLADRLGGAGEGVQAAQETPVRLVLPGNGAVALPTGPAQLVEPPV